MDGDETAKTFDAGANSAKVAGVDLTDGIHEAAHQTPAAGAKTTGTGTSIFSKDGAVGSMFNPEGSIGGMAQKIGGPLDKEGAIGKNFKADGAIGGTIQEKLANKNEGK